MELRTFFRAYAKSPLGLGSIIVALGAGAASAIMGLSPALSIAFALAAFAVLLIAALVAGLGQRAAAVEAERESGAKAAARLNEAAAARTRLAAIRLTQPDMASARDLLVLEGGSFIEDCRRAGSYDPEGVEAIVDSLALVDAWLKQADEESVGKRFALHDAAPFPDAAKKTAQALREKAALVAAKRAQVNGEIPAADRIAIEEELK